MNASTACEFVAIGGGLRGLRAAVVDLRELAFFGVGLVMAYFSRLFGVVKGFGRGEKSQGLRRGGKRIVLKNSRSPSAAVLQRWHCRVVIGWCGCRSVFACERSERLVAVLACCAQVGWVPPPATP